MLALGRRIGLFFLLFEILLIHPSELSASIFSRKSSATPKDPFLKEASKLAKKFCKKSTAKSQKLSGAKQKLRELESMVSKLTLQKSNLLSAVEDLDSKQRSGLAKLMKKVSIAAAQKEELEALTLPPIQKKADTYQRECWRYTEITRRIERALAKGDLYERLLAMDYFASDSVKDESFGDLLDQLNQVSDSQAIDFLLDKYHSEISSDRSLLEAVAQTNYYQVLAFWDAVGAKDKKEAGAAELESVDESEASLVGSDFDPEVVLLGSEASAESDPELLHVLDWDFVDSPKGLEVSRLLRRHGYDVQANKHVFRMLGDYRFVSWLRSYVMTGLPLDGWVLGKFSANRSHMQALTDVLNLLDVGDGPSEDLVRYLSSLPSKNFPLLKQLINYSSSEEIKQAIYDLLEVESQASSDTDPPLLSESSLSEEFDSSTDDLSTDSEQVTTQQTKLSLEYFTLSAYIRCLGSLSNPYASASLSKIAKIQFEDEGGLNLLQAAHLSPQRVAQIESDEQRKALEVFLKYYSGGYGAVDDPLIPPLDLESLSQTNKFQVTAITDLLEQRGGYKLNFSDFDYVSNKFQLSFLRKILQADGKISSNELQSKAAIRTLLRIDDQLSLDFVLSGLNKSRRLVSHDHLRVFSNLSSVVRNGILRLVENYGDQRDKIQLMLFHLGDIKEALQVDLFRLYLHYDWDDFNPSLLSQFTNTQQVSAVELALQSDDRKLLSRVFEKLDKIESHVQIKFLEMVIRDELDLEATMSNLEYLVTEVIADAALILLRDERLDEIHLALPTDTPYDLGIKFDLKPVELGKWAISSLADRFPSRVESLDESAQEEAKIEVIAHLSQKDGLLLALGEHPARDELLDKMTHHDLRPCLREGCYNMVPLQESAYYHCSWCDELRCYNCENGAHLGSCGSFASNGKRVASHLFPGFRNLGNTCFLNSLVKLLAATAARVDPLRKFLQTGIEAIKVREGESDEDRHSRFVLKNTLALLVETTLSGVDLHQDKMAGSLQGFINALHPLFTEERVLMSGRVGRDQMDPEEVLRFILEQIDYDQTELSLGHLDRKVIEGVDDDVRTEDVFPIIPTHIVKEDSEKEYELASLQEALDSVWESELLEGEEAYEMEDGQKAERTYKSLVVTDAPPVLFVQLKRFGYEQGESGFFQAKRLANKVKLNPELKVLRYDEDDLDNPAELLIYRRISAVIHSGGSSPSSGHYQALTWDSGEDQAVCHNDSSVCELASRKAEKLAEKQAYLVSYELIDRRPL